MIHQLNTTIMTTLSLENKKVTNSTADLITVFIYTNRDAISIGVIDFYTTVRGFIEREQTKPAKNRKSMAEILEISYNIEARILESGAASVDTQYISM